MTLPTPRLQYRWHETGSPSVWRCQYELVLPLGEFDVRRADHEDELLTAITWQEQYRDEPITNGVVDIPFPIGAYAVLDRVHLGHLPVYAICGDVVREVLPGVTQGKMQEVG